MSRFTQQSLRKFQRKIRYLAAADSPKRVKKEERYKPKVQFTAPASLDSFILLYSFECCITNLKTKDEQIVNKRAAPKGGSCLKKGN